MNDAATPITRTQLIQQIRSEADDVKQCFTTFTFQSAALSAAALAFVLSGIDRRHEVALIAVPAILLLQLICRIGVFKFTTANRNFGYQLHLARLDAYLSRPHSEDVRRRLREILSVDWEEALRAWRIVQVSVFRALYITPEVRAKRQPLIRLRDHALYWPTRIDPGLYTLTETAQELSDTYGKPGSSLDNDGRYPWWNPKLLTQGHQGKSDERQDPGASIYYTGTYLRDMFFGLHLMQWLLWTPLPWVAYLSATWRERVGYSLVAVAAFTVTAFRQKRIHRRRVILEDEALSIHSCAITWAYVIVVHHWALRNEDRPYSHYTERLASACRNASDAAFQLPGIIDRYIRNGTLQAG